MNKNEFPNRCYLIPHGEMLILAGFAIVGASFIIVTLINVLLSLK